MSVVLVLVVERGRCVRGWSLVGMDAGETGCDGEPLARKKLRIARSELRSHERRGLAHDVESVKHDDAPLIVHQPLP